MRKFKKVLAGTLAGVLAVGALAGCGESNGSSTNNNTTPTNNTDTSGVKSIYFLNFKPEKADWLKPATSISVRGTLDLKLYNNNLDLGCQVKEISEWKFEEKKAEEAQQ